MKRFFAYFLAFVGVALLPTLSFAAVEDLVLGTINELEDDDFETLVNAGDSITDPLTDTTVDVGDILVGIIRISALRVPPGAAPPVESYPQPSNTFTAVFAQKVLTKTVLLGGVADGINDVVYTFTAPTLAEWAGLGLPAHLVATTLGTTAIFFDDPDDLNQSAATLFDAFDTVDGLKLWEFGYPGGSPSNPLGFPIGELFSTAQTDTDDITTAFSVVTGGFTANFDVTLDLAGPPLAPIPVAGGTAQVLVRNGSIGNPAPGSVFPVSTDTDILIAPQVIPEPASMLIWGGLAAGFGIARYRRRKAA